MHDAIMSEESARTPTPKPDHEEQKYIYEAIMILFEYLLVQANIVSQLGIPSQLEIASRFHVPHDPESEVFFFLINIEWILRLECTGVTQAFGFMAHHQSSAPSPLLSSVFVSCTPRTERRREHIIAFTGPSRTIYLQLCLYYMHMRRHPHFNL